MVGEAMSNVQRHLGWDEARAAASRQRVAPVWACSLPDAGADFAIENVATLPEYRRRGLADLLLDVIVRDGSVNHGSSLAQITSYIGNHAAQAAYEKADFKVLDERRCADMQRILGVPGFVRLTRDLKID
jgi:ribosomal protein S18 acetylase RimI-like enzyme